MLISLNLTLLRVQSTPRELNENIITPRAVQLVSLHLSALVVTDGEQQTVREIEYVIIGRYRKYMYSFVKYTRRTMVTTVKCRSSMVFLISSIVMGWRLESNFYCGDLKPNCTYHMTR